MRWEGYVIATDASLPLPYVIPTPFGELRASYASLPLLYVIPTVASLRAKRRDLACGFPGRDPSTPLASSFRSGSQEEGAELVPLGMTGQCGGD